MDNAGCGKGGSVRDAGVAVQFAEVSGDLSGCLNFEWFIGFAAPNR
ncbi:MAG: hypothetical protein QM769_03510 [Pseudoxanthomonas sp.]